MHKLTDLHILILEKPQTSCQDIEDIMCDYADNELAPSVRAKVDSHIEECEYCQEFRDSYIYTIHLARELKNNAPAPTPVQNRLRAALNERLGLKLAPVQG